jgi:hypothetical protein
VTSKPPVGRPRRRRHTTVLPSIRVLVEGDTEDGYLVPFRRRARDRWTVQVDPVRGHDPLALVRLAVERKETAAREEVRGRGAAYDQVWCVFDHDDHPRLPDAFDLAPRHDIQVAFTNPCLELWFILHFEDQTAWISGERAQRRSRQLLGSGKPLSASSVAALVDRFEAAKDRGVRLERKHAEDGSPEGSNPSSSVYRLVSQLADG